MFCFLSRLLKLFCCRVQATQRAGRAGRVCDGKCYRLYTTAFYEKEMSEATVPEIQRTNMLTAVLYLKSLPLDIDVLAFDYLDSPGVRFYSCCLNTQSSRDDHLLDVRRLLRQAHCSWQSEALEDALRQLFVLDALDRDGHITGLGKRMAALPLEPSLARSLVAAADHDCLPDALTVAAMLSADTIFSGNRYLMLPTDKIGQCHSSQNDMPKWSEPCKSARTGPSW